MKRQRLLRFALFGVFYLLYLPSVYAKLKIGVVFFDPPLVVSRSQGFNINLAHKICHGLREECIIVPMEWPDLFVALNKREIDIQLGVYITPERAKHYIFSLPYKSSSGRFMTLTANRLTAINQLKGAKVGKLKEEKGSGVFNRYIEDIFDELFGVANFDDMETLILALTQQSVQAILVHSSAAEYWVEHSGGKFSMLGAPFPLGAGYAIMALPDKQQLINRINTQLRILKANGEFAKIYHMYWED